MEIIKKVSASVSYLFTVFGSFLLNISPPTSLVSGENPMKLTGLVSFIVLGILLTIRALIKQQKRKNYKKWLTAGIVLLISFCVSSYIYYVKLDSKTFTYYDNTIVVKGDTYQLKAKKLKEEFERVNSMDLTDIDLLAKFGGINNTTYVWTIESIKKNEHILSLFYVITVILIATSIFCSIEGVIQKRK